MATADQIKALVRAHTNGDNAKFRAIVLSIAANAEGKSYALAKSLRELAEIAPRPQMFTVLPTQTQSLLSQTNSTTKLDDLVLDPATRARIDLVLVEQASREKLVEHGLSPMRKLLFVGPPGVGKTMTASALACHLDVPLLRVQLHATIASHMGETAAQLWKIFENIRRMRGVYLFDEFDALAAGRGNAQDTGEMRRVVNSLLQFMEEDDSESLIIAATNDEAALDRAMFRRFDDVIHFPMPTADIAERLIRTRLVPKVEIDDWDNVRTAAADISHADLANACDRVSKEAVLADRDVVYTGDVAYALQAKRAEIFAR